MQTTSKFHSKIASSTALTVYRRIWWKMLNERGEPIKLNTIGLSSHENQGSPSVKLKKKVLASRFWTPNSTLKMEKRVRSALEEQATCP